MAHLAVIIEDLKRNELFFLKKRRAYKVMRVLYSTFDSSVDMIGEVSFGMICYRNTVDREVEQYTFLQVFLLKLCVVFLTMYVF